MLIAIINDGYAEGNETFNLRISTSDNATSIANDIISVTILDDDAGMCSSHSVNYKSKTSSLVKCTHIRESVDSICRDVTDTHIV